MEKMLDMHLYGILGVRVKDRGETFGFVNTFLLANSNLPKAESPKQEDICSACL